MSSPNTTMVSSLAIITRWASLIASIMLRAGTALVVLHFGQHLGALLGEVPRHLGIDVVEDGFDVGAALFGQDAELLRFLLRGADGGVDFGIERGIALIVPFAERDEVLLEAHDRVAERPRLGFAGGAVAGRVVGGRMALGPVGEELDPSRALLGPR